MSNYGPYSLEIKGTYVMAISVGVIVTVTLCLLFSVLCLRRRMLLNSINGGLRDDHNPLNGTSGGGGRRGIDEAILDSCPKMLFSEKICVGSSNSGENEEALNDCCSICLSEYRESEIVRVMPECSHMFHMNCVDEWLRLHATCPVCRTPPLIPSQQEPTPLLNIVLQA